MLTLDIHPSQYPAAVKLRLREALARRILPSRFLYDSPAQAARWLAYHAKWSPSRTQEDLLDLYERSFELALEALDGAPRIQYVSLGCGGGNKDARFLQRCQSRGMEVAGVLTDTSPSLVLEALLTAIERAHNHPRGLVVDLEASPSRNAFVAEDLPSIWTAFGMVPNLDHQKFLSWLARLLNPGDVAIVSANLCADPWPAAGPKILPQYDNPRARAWYAGALSELGLEEPEIEIRGEPRDPSGTSWRVEVESRSPRPATLRAFDEELMLRAGETMSVFFSNRFTEPAFRAELAAAGFSITDTLVFENGEEGIWLVEKADQQDGRES